MSRTRRHTHLDGTEHSGTPAAPPPALPPPGASPGLVDGRMLLVALVVCLPAGYRLTEGLVSLTDVLTRYLVVAIGCVLLAAAVRMVWPILSGEAPTPAPAAKRPAGQPAARKAPAPTPGRAPERPVSDPFADLGEFDDPATLLASATDEDHLELSTLPE